MTTTVNWQLSALSLHIFIEEIVTINSHLITRQLEFESSQIVPWKALDINSF